MSEVVEEVENEVPGDLADERVVFVPEPVLNRLPVGTILTLVGVAVAVYALISGQIDFDRFWEALALSGVTGGSIGIARNGAGHGVSG